MRKILILGVSGLTGYRLAILSSKDYRVYGTYNKRTINLKNCEVFQLDKSDVINAQNLIKKIEPNIIVDCSALHNVDYCEAHQEETKLVNVDAPKYITEICKEIGAKMIYLSTDYVYDGTENVYTEESQTNPLNYYGLSKLNGEEVIVKAGIDYAICRTSLIFGWNPNEVLGRLSSSGKTQNYVIWALNKLRNNEKLRIVNDQYSTPTFVDELAETLLELANSDLRGIFHTVGSDFLNRYDFTIKIAEAFDLNKQLIEPVTSDMFKQAAKRPMKCCLDNSKIEKALNIKFSSIQDALIKMRNQENKI